MEIGYIKARVYTSDAMIPIENAVFTVYDNNVLLGTRLTGSDGQTSVIQIKTPDSSLSQYQGNSEPFSKVNIRIDHPDYRTYVVNGVQIFCGQVAIQEAFLLPIDRNVPYDSRAQSYDVANQNL